MLTVVKALGMMTASTYLGVEEWEYLFVMNSFMSPTKSS